MSPETAARHRASRDALVSAILAIVASDDLLSIAEIRSALEAEIDEAGPDALRTLKARLASTDETWRYVEPDPLARRIHHVLADRLLTPDSTLDGVEHLPADPGPVVVFANHLSYADANLLEILLYRAGRPDVAERLTAMAGPKVFTDRTRRFSSLCLGMIRVPQNSGVSSGEAVMNVRDVARAAREAIETAHARLAAGDVVIVFGEGRRSRSGAMQPMLPGVARYVDAPAAWVLPVGITGTDAFFASGDTSVRRLRVTARIGPPLSAERLRAAAEGDRKTIVDAIGLAISALLPERYRGAYAKPEASAAAATVLETARFRRLPAPD